MSKEEKGLFYNIMKTKTHEILLYLFKQKNYSSKTMTKIYKGLDSTPSCVYKLMKFLETYELLKKGRKKRLIRNKRDCDVTLTEKGIEMAQIIHNIKELAMKIETEMSK